MKIIKLNEYYSISGIFEDWKYVGNIDYQYQHYLKISLCFSDSIEGYNGNVLYGIDQKKISSISFSDIPKEKEEIFTKYVNQIIEEMLEYFNFV